MWWRRLARPSPFKVARIVQMRARAVRLCFLWQLTRAPPPPHARAIATSRIATSRNPVGSSASPTW